MSHTSIEALSQRLSRTAKNSAVSIGEPGTVQRLTPICPALPVD